MGRDRVFKMGHRESSEQTGRYRLATDRTYWAPTSRIKSTGQSLAKLLAVIKKTVLMQYPPSQCKDVGPTYTTSNRRA